MRQDILRRPALFTTHHQDILGLLAKKSVKNGRRGRQNRQRARSQAVPTRFPLLLCQVVLLEPSLWVDTWFLSGSAPAFRGLYLAELAFDGALFRRRLAFALATRRRLLRTRARLTIRRGAYLLQRLR